MIGAKFPSSLRQLGLLVFTSTMLLGSSVHADLIVSGDANIINGLNGSDILDQTAGNQTFFRNILGTGTTVKVLSTTVATTEDGVNLDAVVNNYYNGLPGVTSSIVNTPITSSLLAGTNLFIEAVPDAAFTPDEVAAVKTFLANGGTFFFLGENASFTPSQNQFINTDLTALGSGLQLTVNSYDFNINIATVANGQIVSNPLTSGISSFEYAFATGVTGGQQLFLNSDKSASFLSAEPASVPEPSTYVMASIVAAGVIVARRRMTSRRLAADPTALG